LDTRPNQTLAEVGPLKWMAPESIVSKSYSFATDVWSYGVVIWELVSRSEPYPDHDAVGVAMGVCYEGLRLEIPRDCDYFLADIMKSCWAMEPTARPTFKDLCEKFSYREKHKPPKIESFLQIPAKQEDDTVYGLMERSLASSTEGRKFPSPPSDRKSIAVVKIQDSAEESIYGIAASTRPIIGTETDSGIYGVALPRENN